MASYLDPVTTLSGVEDPFAARMRRDFLESAFDLAATPTPIAQQQIAGFDPLEQQARQLAGGLGQFQPFIQQAAGFYGPQGARDFYNPYEDAVVQQTISDLSERSGIQGIADRASAVQAGAFGGSRGRLMESERQRALGRGLAEAIGGIRSRGFEGARAAAQGAASGLAGLAQTGQAGLINQIGTLGQLGGLGRGLQQAGFDATFDAAQRAALEPRQRLQTLQGMLSLLPRTRASTVFRAAAGTDPTAQALGFLRGGGLQGLLGMEKGGFVGAGGKEYPNKGLAALSKSAPEVVERMGYERGGEVFPAEEALNFIEGTGPMGVPYPSGMPAQVFEEGDPEINEALNRMAAAVKPTGEAPKVEVEEAPKVIATELAEVEEKIKEPRGKEGIFLKDVEEQRESLEEAIMTFVEQTNIEAKEPANVKKEIESFINKADDFFKKNVQNSADKLDLDINIDQVTLLTDKFDRKLEAAFPAISDIMESDTLGTTDQEPLMMQEGGEVAPTYSLLKNLSSGELEYLNSLSEKELKSTLNLPDYVNLGNIKNIINDVRQEKAADNPDYREVGLTIFSGQDKYKPKESLTVVEPSAEFLTEFGKTIASSTSPYEQTFKYLSDEQIKNIGGGGENAYNAAKADHQGLIKQFGTNPNNWPEQVKNKIEALEKDMTALAGIPEGREEQRITGIDKSIEELIAEQNNPYTSDERKAEIQKQIAELEKSKAKTEEGVIDPPSPPFLPSESGKLTLEEQLMPYYERLKEYEDKMINAGLMSGKSKEGGLAGAFDVIGQARAKAVPVGMSPDAALIQALSRGTGSSSSDLRTSLSIQNMAEQRLEQQGITPGTPGYYELLQMEMQRILELSKGATPVTTTTTTADASTTKEKDIKSLVTDAGQKFLDDAKKKLKDKALESIGLS